MVKTGRPRRATAEFGLCCTAGDYDTAANVLIDFDREYLSLWGHYRLVISLHEKIFDSIKDKYLQMHILNGLETAHRMMGAVKKAITYLEQGLNTAKEVKNRQAEGVFLGNLGIAYAALGEARQAIEFYEQALAIAREIGDRRSEGAALGNTGLALLSLGEYQQAINFMSQAIQIADEISYTDIQIEERWGLAQAYLFQSDLVNAYTAIKSALDYDVPKYNHNATVLYGVIALRRRDTSAASHAFTRAIAQADEILTKTAEYYEALDAKGLALCGLALVKDLTGFTESPQDGEAPGENLSV